MLCDPGLEPHQCLFGAAATTWVLLPADPLEGLDDENHYGAEERTGPVEEKDGRNRRGDRCVGWETAEDGAQDVSCSKSENLGDGEEELGEKEGREVTANRRKFHVTNT